MAAPLTRSSSVPEAVRGWWDDVPEPDKGILTAGAGFTVFILLLLTFLVLHAA
jgi:hypothetical protein